MSSESQALLEHPNRTLRDSLRSKAKSCLSSNLFLPSKGAIIILLWTAILSYTGILVWTAISIENFDDPHSYKISAIALAEYISVEITVITYPLWGFVADFCCGRFKVVMISLCLFTVAVALACPTALLLIYNIGKNFGGTFKLRDFFKSDSIAIFIVLVIVIILVISGSIGYFANYIQFGLDQLHEAQSEYLGLFAHYITWMPSLGALISTIVVETTLLNKHGHHMHKLRPVVTDTALFTLATGALVLLLITCCKHHCFYVELPQRNPYKTVYKVLQFARRHKYPLQRSAFTYCDDYLPSRIDFAKERYGGPFSTEEVENVKTLFRIIVILISLGPVFALQVPASRYIFPLFGYHTHLLKPNTHWISFVDNGLLMSLAENILFSLYIWYTFSYLRKRIPKMLVRLMAGIIFSLLGVISMLITDAVGHSVASKNTSTNATVQCMFQVTAFNYTNDHQFLDMHWYVLIPPSVFLGIGPLVVIATTIEFISAQSPHSMKSLLIGVFFAIQGFSRLAGYLITVPFFTMSFWFDKSGISCGSAYLLIISIVGLVGLISFSVAAMRYKYRKRDDENFRQRDIEEVYTRYLSQRVGDIDH